MSKRRRFTLRFKAQVALEELTGARGSTQICREHGIRHSMLTRWKREFLGPCGNILISLYSTGRELAPEAPWNRVPHATGQVFERGGAQNQYEERICELERMLGSLTMELEISKKASLLLRSPRNGNES